MGVPRRQRLPRTLAEDVSLRLVMLHEYARHNGDADFLREAVDGV